MFVYAVQLARELVHHGNGNEYTLFFCGEVHPAFRELEGKFRAVVFPVRNEVLAKQVFMAAHCNALRLDLIHFPAFPPPAAYFRPFVWTLHDATPWLYPETMDLKGRMYFRWVGAWGARCSRAIITVSEDSKRRITQLLRVPESKVQFVIHGGVDGGFERLDDPELLQEVRARYRLPERFILTVATLEPRKNLPFLVEAYRRFSSLAENNSGLVIAGRAGWKLASLQHALRESGHEFVLTGFVPQRHLVALYNMADVFVLPSLYEGFGLPPLEAMACGCPVIVSNRGSLPEVVGDAALLIDPESLESLVAAIRRVSGDRSLRDELRRKGFERVKHFSWSTTAARTLDLYRQAAASRA